MAEFKNHLRITHRKTIFIGDAPPQDERIVVEAEVLRIEKDDLPYSWFRLLRMLRRKLDVVVRGGLTHELCILMKTRDRGKFDRIQDQLAFEVVDLVQRMAIAVASRFEIRETLNFGVFGFQFL